MTKYLQPERISVASKTLPIEPFIVRPADYYVIDGDTIGVNTTQTDDHGKRLRSFSIRLRSVMAPEKKRQRTTSADIILGKLGRKPKNYDPGSFSHSTASILLRGRCILIIPGNDRKKDAHGRLLGDVYVSGSHGKRFDFSQAFSLERVLLSDSLVTKNPDESVPDLRLPSSFSKEVQPHPSHPGRPNHHAGSRKRFAEIPDPAYPSP